VIFVTVGVQLPFDRLIRAVDELAPLLSQPVFAQTGRTSYRPSNIQYSETLAPREFGERFDEASMIVSHAGIGTIMRALKLSKPIVVFPRYASNGEHRNDHQLATCAQLKDRDGIYVAHTASDLQDLLTRAELGSPDMATLEAKRRQFTLALRSHLSALPKRPEVHHGPSFSPVDALDREAVKPYSSGRFPASTGEPVDRAEEESH
jgi:UDP-N-acetylglucosamine transferase subunit ALG13